MPRVLVADDNGILRRILKATISEHLRWAVCGEAADGQEAVLFARELHPDVILLDLAMPIMDGLRAAVEILRHAPTVPIVLYTLHMNPQLELEAKKAGIKASVSKRDDPAVLLSTLERIWSDASAATTATASPIGGEEASTHLADLAASDLPNATALPAVAATAAVAAGAPTPVANAPREPASSSEPTAN